MVRESGSLFAPDSEEVSNPTDKTWTGLPVVTDEVFTGLYRLGHASPSHLLHVDPDISVYAKLLTGGLLPLSCTLASESIFEAFLADGKADALLHGHSYTAHAVGCNVGDTSLKILNKLDQNGTWESFKQDWAGHSAASSLAQTANTIISAALGGGDAAPTASASPAPPIWSVWSTAFVASLSHATERVDSVWALGSVLAISLKDAAGGGYASNAAATLRQQLLEAQGRDWNIHSRVLGNVLYLMTGQTTKEADVRLWEKLVLESLNVTI